MRTATKCWIGDLEFWSLHDFDSARLTFAWQASEATNMLSSLGSLPMALFPRKTQKRLSCPVLSIPVLCCDVLSCPGHMPSRPLAGVIACLVACTASLAKRSEAGTARALASHCHVVGVRVRVRVRVRADGLRRGGRGRHGSSSSSDNDGVPQDSSDDQQEQRRMKRAKATHDAVKTRTTARARWQQE